MSQTAAELGVAWWTVMDQVIHRGTPLVDDPARLAPAQHDPAQAPVTALGVDETAFLRATGTHPTLFATGDRRPHPRPGGPTARCGRRPLRHGPRAAQYTLVGAEWDAWEELRGIAFLLSDE